MYLGAEYFAGIATIRHGVRYSAELRHCFAFVLCGDYGTGRHYFVSYGWIGLAVGEGQAQMALLLVYILMSSNSHWAIFQACLVPWNEVQIPTTEYVMSAGSKPSRLGALAYAVTAVYQIYYTSEEHTTILYFCR